MFATRNCQAVQLRRCNGSPELPGTVQWACRDAQQLSPAAREAWSVPCRWESWPSTSTKNITKMCSGPQQRWTSSEAKGERAVKGPPLGAAPEQGNLPEYSACARHCAKLLACINSFNPHIKHTGGKWLFIPNWQMRKLLHREVEWLLQCHTAIETELGFNWGRLLLSPCS